MGCDGSRQTNLTNHSANDRQPSWASGGKLAFSSNRNSEGGYDIYLLTLDPWQITRLTTNAADDVSPALSPDGSKVAYVSYRGEGTDSEIYVLTVSDRRLIQITDNTAADVDPAWSSDGTKLAFASDRDGDWDVYTADADGSNATNLTDSETDDEEGHNDRWPDLMNYFGDETIAFSSDRKGTWDLFSMYDDGSDQIGLESSNLAADVAPSWNKSGEQMVFHTDRNPSLDVFKALYDGTSWRNITSNDARNSSHSDWEPVDGVDYCEGD